jgi:pyruvate formate-lyase activating enzyme-like uncharacterized protein
MTTKDFRFYEYVDYQNQNGSSLFNRILGEQALTGEQAPTIPDLEKKVKDLTKLVNHLTMFINLTNLKVRCQIDENSNKNQP